MENLKTLLLLAVLAFTAAFSSSANAQNSENRNVPAFTKIGLSYPADVVLRQGRTQSLKLEGDAEVLAKIETEVTNGRLHIKRKDQGNNTNWITTDQDRITIYITVPAVEALSVSGSGKIKGEDTFKTTSLDLAVSGSGRIALAAEVEKVTSRIAGSGTIELKGEGKQSTVSVSGSGSLKAYGFKTDAATVSISGSGSCEVNAASTLKSNISGSGRVSYEGSPNVDSRVSGSGSVKKRA